MDWSTCKQSYQALLCPPQQQDEDEDEQHFLQHSEDAQSQRYEADQEFRYKREDRHDEDNDAQYARPLSRSDSGSYFGGGDRFSTDPGYAMPLTTQPLLSSSYHHHQPNHHQSQDASSLRFPPAPMSMEVLNNSSNCSLNSIHSLDLQNFDESASIDLQQLFPPLPSLSSSNADALQQQQQQHHQTPHTMLSYYALQTPQPPASNEYFVEGFHNFHSDPSQGIPPLSFMGASQQAAMFDEREELGLPEMQEVSNLFNNASMMTPPTSIMTPRTSIVSPMHGFPSSRAGGSAASGGNGNGGGGGGIPASAAMLMHESSSDDGESGGGSCVPISANPKFSPDRRKLCCIEGCKSQARAFNRCKRHGGSKRCSHPGCTKSVQSRGLCIRHGGGSRCQENGCTRAAQSHGRCKMHGGGRPCIVEDCEKKAHLKRLCRKHGGGAKCSLEGCGKWAQRQGMCMTHSKHTSSPVVGGGGGRRAKDSATAAAAAISSASLSPVGSMTSSPPLHEMAQR